MFSKSTIALNDCVMSTAWFAKLPLFSMRSILNMRPARASYLTIGVKSPPSRRRSGETKNILHFNSPMLLRLGPKQLPIPISAGIQILPVLVGELPRAGRPNRNFRGRGP